MKITEIKLIPVDMGNGDKPCIQICKNDESFPIAVSLFIQAVNLQYGPLNVEQMYDLLQTIADCFRHGCTNGPGTWGSSSESDNLYVLEITFV